MVKCMSELTGKLEEATILPGYIGYDGTVVYEPIADIDLATLFEMETENGMPCDDRFLRRHIKMCRRKRATPPMTREERVERHMLRVEREMAELSEEELNGVSDEELDNI